MRYLKDTILLFAILLQGVLVSSQSISNFLHFEQFSVADGLAGNDIRATFQDSRGFIWIGTAEGLSRYDGRIFKKYTRIGKDGLTDLSINCITEDAEGSIWVGTENGLNKLDPLSESITRYYEGNGPGTIPYKWCNYVYVDKSKTLWMSSEKGIAAFDKRSNRFDNYPVTVFGKDARINKTIPKILEDRKGRFWLATSYGVKLFDRKTGLTFRSFHFTEGGTDRLKKNIIYSMFEDSKGCIWAGTFAGGLYLYNEKTGQFEDLQLTGIKLSDYVIEDMCELTIRNRHFLILAVGGGIVYLRYPDKEPVNSKPHSAVFDQAEYLAGKLLVTRFLSDAEHNLWWSGHQGLYKMNAGRLDYQWLPVSSKENPDPFIFHVIPDPREPERFFYLTANEGWWKYDIRTSAITPHVLPAAHHLKLTTINHWYPDKDGYWFTSIHGFGYYDIYRNQVIDLSALPEKMTGQLTTGFIEKDLSGKIWLALRRSGILIYDPVTKTAEQFFADTTKTYHTYGQSITDLQLGPDGKIYFCAPFKLYRVDPADRSVETFNTPSFPEPIDKSKICPRRIHFTPDNRVLVISNFRIYELKDDQLRPVYPPNGLSDFSMENIVAGSGDDIWITTAQTVLKTNTSFSNWANKGELLGINKGFPPFQVHTLPGQVLFTGDGGIGLLQYPGFAAATIPRPVIISRVKHGEHELFLASEKKISLQASYKNAIEIDISPVSYLAEKENQVLYRLEGWDDNWKMLTGTFPIRYEQLPPGHYNFKTKAVSSAGKESKESSFSFSITPPFYRTWWFISMVVAVIGLAIFSFYRYRLQSALKLERLRTTIATDLHDDIGATLSSISMYSEAVKNQVKDQLPHLEPVLDKMGENSRDMVTSMSDIVWAINPDNDDGKKLAQRIENHARDLCALKNVTLQFSCNADMSHIKLPLGTRKNIYLIFKEALNNALKYSQATSIAIQLSKENQLLRLQVKDNGKGFDSTTPRSGNGLKNMTQRAKEIGARLDLHSNPGEGTAIGLNCPL